MEFGVTDNRIFSVVNTSEFATKPHDNCTTIPSTLLLVERTTAPDEHSNTSVFSKAYHYLSDIL